MGDSFRIAENVHGYNVDGEQGWTSRIEYRGGVQLGASNCMFKIGQEWGTAELDFVNIGEAFYQHSPKIQNNTTHQNDRSGIHIRILPHPLF